MKSILCAALLAPFAIVAGVVVDASSFGFSPSAEPAVNTAALQKALDGGNKKVVVSKPGVYGMDRTVFMDSHTEIEFAKGVVLEKRKLFSHLLVNRGAYERTWNEDITVRGMNIRVNGFEMVPQPPSPAHHLRGQLAFYHAKHVRVYDFSCKDLGVGQYCIHFTGFEDVLVDGVEIFGRKDGIHFNSGHDFVVRNGTLSTCDDGIAVNAGDWPDCAPEMGSIYNGLVERIKFLPTPPSEAKKPGELGLVIAGVWKDWHPGMMLQRNDAVRVGKNVYAVSPMPLATGTNEIASFTAPTHLDGVWKSPEGINFMFVQSNGVCRADVWNVTFRDIDLQHPHGLSVGWEVGSEWARMVHPEIKPEDYPKIDIVLERVKSSHPNYPIAYCRGHGNVMLRDCTPANVMLSGGVQNLTGGRGPYPGLKRVITVEDCDFSGKPRWDFIFNGPADTEMVFKNLRGDRKPTVCVRNGATVKIRGDESVCDIVRR